MKRLLAFLLCAVASPTLAQTTAIVGGTLAIGDGSQPMPDGVVLFRDGRIIAAGAGIAVPPGAIVIDAHGKWVAAGMVAAFSDLGLFDVDAVSSSNDSVVAAGSPFHASVDVAPAVNTASAEVGIERAGGVTGAVIAPGATQFGAASHSIFDGLGAVIDLGSDSSGVIKTHAFELVELGESGAKAAGGTRSAAYAELHDAFDEAMIYRRNPKVFQGNVRDAIVNRQDAIVLGAVLDGKVPLLAHVERASDILSALHLRREYPHLRLILLGAAEGWMVASKIAAANVPVIAGALMDVPEAFERLASTESNVGLMEKAGVVVAISTLNMTEPAQQRRMHQEAGNLVAVGKMPGMAGLDWGQAFASITSTPAKIMGLAGDIGSLSPGRRADVVIWNGDPLEVGSIPIEVYIDGRVQPTASRQTELRDRYAEPPSDLPQAYRR
jgi:imidazolonepropionase-like amidohydrolase